MASIITEGDIFRIGEEALYRILGVENREDFIDFMEEICDLNPYDIGGFAAWMTYYYSICDLCGAEYIEKPEIHCKDCLKQVYHKY